MCLRTSYFYIRDYMSLHLLDEKLWFPPLHDALPDGLLAVGGDLSVERLLLAYKRGIFPWFENDEIPMWWSPNPRFVLFPQKLHISHSMRPFLNSNTLRITTNRCFKEVISACESVKRPGQEGTWITEEVKKAYTELHKLGHAESIECWHEGKLVGGLYGLRIGKVFFGESMFSQMKNASKFAFIKYVQDYLIAKYDIQIIDCQVYSAYLESLGAEMINREAFVEYLRKYL